MKIKPFHILFAVYLITLAADLLSTLKLGELVQYLEANPLFKFGGLPLIIILNLAIAAVYYWIYKKGSVNARFIAIFCLVTVITTRIIVVRNNLAIAANPPTIEQAMAVTQAMKTAVISKLVWLNALPTFNGLIAWLFFKSDHDIRRKEE